MDEYIEAKVKNNSDTYRRLINMVKVNNAGDEFVATGLWMQQVSVCVRAYLAMCVRACTSPPCIPHLKLINARSLLLISTFAP